VECCAVAPEAAEDFVNVLDGEHNAAHAERIYRVTRKERTFSTTYEEGLSAWTRFSAICCRTPMPRVSRTKCPNRFGQSVPWTVR
jgi:hypothetical protein